MRRSCTALFHLKLRRAGRRPCWPLFFLKEHAFLLIDEPTNQSGRSCQGKGSRLSRTQERFILVSHDRDFLDRCVDHVLVLNRRSLEVRKGNFSSWYQDKTAKDRMEIRQNEQLKQEIRKLKDAARQASDWSDKIEKTKTGSRIAGLRPDRGHIGHQAAKMMKRAKNLENRKENAIEQKQSLLKDVETLDSLKLNIIPHHSRRLVSLQDVSVSTGNTLSWNISVWRSPRGNGSLSPGRTAAANPA